MESQTEIEWFVPSFSLQKPHLALRSFPCRPFLVTSLTHFVPFFFHLLQVHANNPHRLAPSSPPSVPHAPRDSLDRRQHRRPIPLGSSRLPRQASARRSHRHVHRRQVRGDPCSFVSFHLLRAGSTTTGLARVRRRERRRATDFALSTSLLHSYSVDEFVYMTENGYTKDEILKGERIVLQVRRLSQFPHSTRARISLNSFR